ncbi:uncharacterized protein LOC135497715 [Lineus longissimus]|uniref:uncharacterized protein LOC135497715 n=1 Tax=Lineus longissimus TaxID=88925 RepID=UPI00315D9565
MVRFRKGSIGLACDIEGMYHQVGVDKDYRNILRFLWWDKGDLTTQPTEYRMAAQLFGGASSPSCAKFALRTAADEFESKHGKLAADFVRDDFYVADGVTSLDSVEDTLELVTNSIKLCGERGFRLHKFVSNDRWVLDAVPTSERGKNIQHLDLRQDELPLERTLGMEWHVKSDCFRFSVNLKDKPLTSRGILSTVSSIFDPLGLVSPVLLQGKMILQDLCHQKADWDDPIPDKIRMRWGKWRMELMTLKELQIPRCLKSMNFGTIQKAELHSFADASEYAYGQCSYLKLVDESGQVETALVMSKARVAPVKVVMIPRLELTAAVTCVKVGTFLNRELKIEDLELRYYTDSTVVLGYISNETKKFHIFVANRTQHIRDVSSPQQWSHVNTTENPADIASRGSDAK